MGASGAIIRPRIILLTGVADAIAVLRWEQFFEAAMGNVGIVVFRALQVLPARLVFADFNAGNRTRGKRCKAC